MAHVRYLVEDAIRRQLVSDVPIGTFLSGGLDSSVISAVASRTLGERGEQLRTFSVDYRDNDRYFTAGKFQPSADGPYITEMADYLGTLHTNVVLDPPQVAAALYPAAEARDLPGMADVDSSLLLFCQAVRKDVTVAVSGECADEIFGGYPWFRDPSVRPENGFPWAQSTAWRASFLTPEYARRLDAGDIVRQRYRATLRQAECLDSDTDEQKRVRRLMRLNTDWFMQTLLDRKDRMSMWSALEVRVPFCDWRIAEYLYNVPPELTGDILDSGLYLTGGGALLDGFAERLKTETQLAVNVSASPQDDTVTGAGKCASDDRLARALIAAHSAFEV